MAPPSKQRSLVRASTGSGCRVGSMMRHRTDCIRGQILWIRYGGQGSDPAVITMDSTVCAVIQKEGLPPNGLLVTTMGQRYPLEACFD